MESFEYSIQLSDRDWAEFYAAAEECSLRPAALAAAEEPRPGDLEGGDGAPARGHPASTDGRAAARPGGGPGPGAGSSAPRGGPADASPRRPAGGHLAPPEGLSGGADGMEPGSAGRLRRESDERGGPGRAPAMPGPRGRQPPRAPAAGLAAGREAAAPEEGAAGAEPPAAAGGGAGGEQPPAARPGAARRGASPPASPRGPAGRGASGAARSEPARRAPPSELAPGAPPQAAPGPPEDPRARAARAAPGSAGGSLEVVRPKTPAQPRRSRKQRGASAAEAALEDGEAAGAAVAGGLARGGAPAPPLLPSRRSGGQEEAAEPGAGEAGSEEAGQGGGPAPGPGADEGACAASAAPELRAKEAGPQLPGRGTEPGPAGAAGVRGAAPPVLAGGPAAPRGGACRAAAGKPPDPEGAAAPGRDAAAQAGGQPAAETPGAPEGSARGSSLEVTWPEMYDYLFCDSQGEEEGMGNQVEEEKIPLEREISLPELYEYFFIEPEGKRKKAKGKERNRKKLRSLDQARLQNEDPGSTPVKESLVISVPEVYEHFFADGPGRGGGWRGIFLTPSTSEVKKAVGALKSLLQRPMHLVRGRVPAPHSLVQRGSGEKLPLIPLAPLGRGQAQPEGLDMALALTGRPEAPLALTHKDMCLVFCAFASWAVKTSDLQAPDAWKTMFLATFGTLSAIRYFRRQVREGHHQT